ncbi:hypothetical protein E2P63_08925 [Candidatus Bathyarchaeota archaeon]|nr:hypothetical protein E2P63_08925 [Candidatus Bathyarchaeota archaeon]
MNLRCFESIAVSEPVLQGNSVETKISCINTHGEQHSFHLRFKYEEPPSQNQLALLRLASVMPLLNYGLFTKEIRLEWQVSKADFSLLNDFLDVFSKDIFINKLVRKKNLYVLPQFLPSASEVTEANSRPMAKIVEDRLIEDAPILSDFNENSCGVLSSGGKESLLTFAMLKEMGADVHPLYVNESGGHWRTALPAYRHFKENYPNTARVWTNVDRFYTFMLDQMRIIRKNHREIWADTYPIRLCIFPVYVFLLLPIFVKRRIGNVLIGSEFDDPRMASSFAGIKHFFGVYDQTQDFDVRMEQWFSKRLRGMHQWSAVRTISGLIVERILTSRYPKMARLQRSCHSCRFNCSDLLPCGKCSKCQGVLLFLLANNVDPSIMGYSEADVLALPARIAEGNLRLDEDEKNYALFLSKLLSNLNRETLHIETIHLNKATSDLQLLPGHFRSPLLEILMKYTKGFSTLKGESWVAAPKPSDLTKAP